MLDGLGQHLEDLLERAASRATSRTRIRTVARPARSSSRRAIAIALVRHDRRRARGRPGSRARGRARRAARRAARELSSPSAAAASSSSSTAPWSAIPGASRRPRSRSPPARAARRRRARGRSPPPSANASSASSALPARWLAVPSSSRTSAALRRGVDSELERGAQPRRRLVEGERGGGRPRGADVVSTPRCGAAERRGGGEVVREVGERAARAVLGALERLADAQVKLRAPHRREPVVERPPHELVREAVGEPARRELLDHPAADRLVEAPRAARAPSSRRRARTIVELELRARGGRELEQVGGRRAPGARAAG